MPADFADDLFFVEGSAARETPMFLALLVTGAFRPGRSNTCPGHFVLFVAHGVANWTTQQKLPDLGADAEVKQLKVPLYAVFMCGERRSMPLARSLVPSAARTAAVRGR